MAIITEAIDGDTFKQENELGRDLPDLRIGGAGTQESEHHIKSKNTQEGRDASRLMKTVAASGNMRKTHDYGRDHFNREVGSGAKTINGVDIDLGFVAMVAGYSTYNTRYGKVKDPALHNNYKEFWSDKMPYQAGELRKPMDPKDWQEIADAQVAFDKAYSDLKNGESDLFPKWGTEELQENFDQALYNLHKDQNKVAHFQHANAGWGREVTEENVTNSDTDSILFALQDDPAAMEQYNRAMRQEGLSIVKYPEKEKGFWEEFGATFSQMGSYANHVNARATGAARLNKEVYDIPVEDFTKGVPPNFHAAILEEVDVYGEAAGLEKRKQVIEDVENNNITSDMEWYKHLGYGLAVALTDPLTYVTGLGVGKAVQATDKSVKMWQLGNAIQGTRLWSQTQAFSQSAKMASYAGAGALETGIVQLPQLGGDHMYNVRDYAMDITAGAALGSLLGIGIDATKAGIDRRKRIKAEIAELEQHVNNPTAPKHNAGPQVEKEVEITNAGRSQETVDEWVGPRNAGVEAAEDFLDASDLGLGGKATPRAPTKLTLRNLLNRHDTATHRSEELAIDVTESGKDTYNVEVRLPKTGETTSLKFDDAVKALDYANSRIEANFSAKKSSTTPEGVTKVKAEDFLDVGTTTPKKVDATPNEVVTGHSNINKALHAQKFTPWEVIQSVDTATFQKVSKKISKLFPKKSHVGGLIDQQFWLNKRRLSEETQTVAEEINSEIIHLASVYPDGKVPKSVEDTIQGVIYTQKHGNTVNVIDQVLTGKSASESVLLGKYIGKLENLGTPEANVPAVKELRKRLRKEESDGTEVEVAATKAEITKLQEIPKPLTSLDFYARFSDIMNMERKADKDDIFTLTQDVPKEVSFLKDMMEMNNQARKSKDADFKKLVERLNGIVAKKLDDLDAQSKAEMLRSEGDVTGLTAIFNQQTKSHGKQVKLTGAEITARMKDEGIEHLTPEWKAAVAKERAEGVVTTKEIEARLNKDRVDPNKDVWKTKFAEHQKTTPTDKEIAARLNRKGIQQVTTQWKKRFAQLRKGSAFVSPEVNKIGKLEKPVVGTTRTKQDVDAPESEIIHKARMELDKLNKLPPEKLEKADKTRIKELQAQIDNQFAEKSKGLEHEADTNDILPRTLTESTSTSAYKEPTVENLTKLRDKLRAVNKQNGSTVVPKKMDDLAKRVRLKKVTARVVKSPTGTIQRAVDNGTLGDIVDVIRASSTLANTAKMNTKPKPRAEQPSTKTTSGKAKAPEQHPESKGMKDVTESSTQTKLTVEGRMKQATLNKEAVIATTEKELQELKATEAERLPSFDAVDSADGTASLLQVEAHAEIDATALRQFNDKKAELVEKLRKEKLSLQELSERIKKAKEGRDVSIPPATVEAHVQNATITKEEVDMAKPVTEEEVDVLLNAWETLTPDEALEVTTRVEAATKAAVQEKGDKITNGLNDWVRRGGERLLVLSASPNGAVDYMGRMLTRLTKGVGEIFVDSNLTSMRYFGGHVTELGRGFGGKAKRRASSATIKDTTFKGSITKAMPQYRKAIDSYAASKGKGAIGRMKARERSGESDPTVNDFNRDLFLVKEYRRQGKPIPKTIHKSVTDFADQFDHYMNHNHKALVDADAAGFTAGRKVDHYIPHIWTTSKFNTAIKTHGRVAVTNVLAKGYRTLNPDLSKTKASKQAEDLIDNVIADKWSATDQYSPTMDSRAKTRRDLDTTTEIDGLSVLDLLDTDVQGLVTKYSHRVGGWVGLAKGTDGMLTSQLDIDVFKANMAAEAAEKGVNPKRYLQMVDDIVDQLFGRPTKNIFSDTKGLAPELRNFADLAVLTKMGGLGSSQLIESGQALTRTGLMAMSEPKSALKVLSMGRGDNKSDRLLMEEIQSISNITEDLEFLDRQQAHLDQTILDETNAVRQISLKIADLATGGELKAEASRGLGKLSSYNMVRRAQSRVAQGSFILDIANHFTKGTGVMGNARMADVGLTDTNGVNDALKSMFYKHAEFDNNGVLTRLHVDKWDRDTLDELAYAINRDEAQQIQRTHIGELPPWMNKPMMGLIFQFRQMPIVAGSKSLGRAMAFADKEAVTGVVLNTAMAGLVRYSKFALLAGATGAVVGKFGDHKEITEEQTQIEKYIAQNSIFPDLNDLIFGRSGIASIDTDNGMKAFGRSAWDAVSGQIPVMGIMNDYYEAGESIVKGDLKGLADSAENLMLLSNLALAEVMFAGLGPLIDKLPDVAETKKEGSMSDDEESKAESK